MKNTTIIPKIVPISGINENRSVIKKLETKMINGAKIDIKNIDFLDSAATPKPQ